eukprot:749378-Hanusia_phi.AAC.1
MGPKEGESLSGGPHADRISGFMWDRMLETPSNAGDSSSSALSSFLSLFLFSYLSLLLSSSSSSSYVSFPPAHTAAFSVPGLATSFLPPPPSFLSSRTLAHTVLITPPERLPGLALQRAEDEYQRAKEE